MGDIFWGDRKPGSDVSTSTEDPSVLLIGASVPDWVRTPRELGPVLGGKKLRVAGTFRAECPKCHASDRRHFRLENSILGVCECVGCGFAWYSR